MHSTVSPLIRLRKVQTEYHATHDRLNKTVKFTVDHDHQLLMRIEIEIPGWCPIVDWIEFFDWISRELRALQDESK